MPFRLLSVALALLPCTAQAARVSPSASSASSVYPDEGGVSYDASKVSDGKVATAWVEGDAGSGLNSWVQLDLGGEKRIQRIKAWAGLWSSGDYWKRANRPKEIQFEYSDGSKDIFNLKDEMTAQEFTLPQVRTTRFVKARLRGIYDGTTWLDTAISELQVFDATADIATPIIRAVLASSTLKADADSSYAGLHTVDGIVDSMWCEGNKEGDGTKEWLEFQFSAPHSVSHLTLINGIGTSMPVWMKANRATAATLTFADGSSAPIAIKNSVMSQSIEFPAKNTTKVRVTFDTVVKGKEYNDLCISEASFAR